MATAICLSTITLCRTAGIRGYIEMPFSEMINAYPPNDKYYNADLIDFIGFKVVSGATIQNADIYMADLSAYREVFW